MAYLLENGTDRYLLESGSGLYLLENEGQTIVEADGNASGLGGSTVAGVALWVTLLASAGGATVLGTATNTEAVDGTASGVSVASGLGAAFVGADCASAGVGTPAAVGRTSLHGVTKDSAGAPLGSCVVQVFRTSDDAFQSEVTSSAAGQYVMYPDVAGPFYIVAYKAGSPDVAGTTVNTLEPD